LFLLQEIEIGGYKIAPGTMIMPLQWAVHTDPKLWGNDVMEFRPERFLSSEGRISKPDCFIPFQTGARLFFNIYIYIYQRNGLFCVLRASPHNGDGACGQRGADGGRKITTF
jgi:Cytochrome P450